MITLLLILDVNAGVYDQDAPAELLLSKPALYKQGRLSLVYKSYSFWINMADALYQSIVIYFVSLAVSNISLPALYYSLIEM
jgi:hypothetical protein